MAAMRRRGPHVLLVVGVRGFSTLRYDYGFSIQNS